MLGDLRRLFPCRRTHPLKSGESKGLTLRLRPYSALSQHLNIPLSITPGISPSPRRTVTRLQVPNEQNHSIACGSLPQCNVPTLTFGPPRHPLRRRTNRLSCTATKTATLHSSMQTVRGEYGTLALMVGTRTTEECMIIGANTSS